MKKKIDIAKKKNWQGIADDIREAINNGSLKPEEMLQGESSLAEQYSTGLYSIRSAIKSLKKEGYLYSVPKRGVFVSDIHTASEEMNEKKAPAQPHDSVSETREVVQYVTRGSLPLQRAIYEEIARSYSSTSISSALKIIYHQGSPAQMHPKSDIYEYGSLSRFCFSDVRFVNLKKYFSHIIHSQEYMYNDTSLPLFRSVPLMIYNKKLLSALSIPLPSFQTYDEQMTYLDELTSSIALQSSYCMPGTAQNMMQKLGNIRREFYKDIVDFKLSIQDAIKKYTPVLQRITSYWRKYHISYPGRTQQSEQEFISGRAPIFFGLSSHYVTLQSKQLPFEIEAALMLSHDNTVDNDLGLVSIDEDTPRLVEAARVVNFLQNEEYQRRFAALGYLPMLEAAKKETPLDTPDSFELAYPLICASQEEHYITVNIINVELWNVVLFDKSIDNALDSIFSFSRSYLQMKLDKAAIDAQSMKSNIYM